MRTPSTDTLIDVAVNHGLRIGWHRGGPKAAWRPPRKISLQLGMTDPDTVCALAHELGHFAHGDACGEDQRAEARAWRHAADILIDPEQYRTAELAFGPHPARLAAELGVTTHVIAVWRDAYERISRS